MGMIQFYLKVVKVFCGFFVDEKIFNLLNDGKDNYYLGEKNKWWMM